MTKKKDDKIEYEVETAAETEAQEAEVQTETEDEQNDEQKPESANPNPLPPNANKTKGRWWLKYLITAGVLAVLTVLLAWWRGAFEMTDKKTLLGLLSDAFSVPGIFAVCFGLLILASNGGAFDMLSYGVRSLFRLLKKDPVDRKYGGFYEYRKARREKKRSFWYLVIVGGAYLLIGMALLGAYFAV